jgi:biotin carboxyl carrier protein
MILEIDPWAVDDPDPAPDAGRVASALPRSLADRGGPARYEVVVDGWRFEVEVESVARAALRERASRAGKRGLGGGPQVVRAQIPGRIVTVGVSAGEAVEAGQRLLSVEAMKMENAVIAPWAGTIARVEVVAGQTVELGDALVVIE